MTSNGTLIEKTLAKELLAAGLRGIIFRSIRPTVGSTTKYAACRARQRATLKALEYFGRYKHKGKLTLRVNTTVSRLNYRTLLPLPDLLAGLGVDDLNLIGVDDHWDDELVLHRRELADYNSRIGRPWRAGCGPRTDARFRTGLSFRAGTVRSRRGPFRLLCFRLVPPAPLLRSLVSQLRRLQWPGLSVLHDPRARGAAGQCAPGTVEGDLGGPGLSGPPPTCIRHVWANAAAATISAPKSGFVGDGRQRHLA